MKFESLQLTVQEKGYFNVLEAFSVRIWLEQCQIYNFNYHTCCFIALTLAGSLDRCFDYSAYQPVFKQLPWDL